MSYYGEHKKEGLGCPCKWVHAKAKVTHLHGNFAHVVDLTNVDHKTAFYHLDLTLVQRAGAEDGQD